MRYKEQASAIPMHCAPMRYTDGERLTNITQMMIQPLNSILLLSFWLICMIFYFANERQFIIAKTSTFFRHIVR